MRMSSSFLYPADCFAENFTVGTSLSEFNLTDYGVPLSVSFTIINTKEPAYEANLYIVHPLALSYVGADKETVFTSNFF